MLVAARFAIGAGDTLMNLARLAARGAAGPKGALTPARLRDMALAFGVPALAAAIIGPRMVA